MDKKNSVRSTKPRAVLVSDIKPRPTRSVPTTKSTQQIRRAGTRVLDLRKPHANDRVGNKPGNIKSDSNRVGERTIKPSKPVQRNNEVVDGSTSGGTVRPTKLNKKINNLQKDIDKISKHITKHVQRFILERWDHIKLARGSVIGWMIIMLVLIGAGLAQILWYDSQTTTIARSAGGTYAEGAVDRLTTISPLYASTDTEKALSQLVYPGLLKYDETGHLQGDLAATWSHDTTGLIWTVRLKPNLKWSDGKSLTADDVAYTVALMKKKDISQILANSWKTITAEAKQPDEVEFRLENPYMSFPTALTFGVVPKHILNKKTHVEINSLFSANTAVPGSGPFTLSNVETSGTNGSQSIWHFVPNKQYYGKPSKLDEITIRTYNDQSSLASGLKRGEVNAISNVSIDRLKQFDDNQYKTIQLRTADGVYALFNNDSAIMTASVRNALRLATNRVKLRQDITEGNRSLSTPTPLESPIATGVYQSIDQLKQPEYNQQLAAQTLDQAGWQLMPGSSLRQHDGKTLDINIVTIKDTNYSSIARQIATQWQQIGVNAKVFEISPAEAQQNYLIPRNYDVLIYQMHLGSDPDVFAYWSLTQTGEAGLNFANYTSRRAEIALSAGRTNPNQQVREARYLAFVEQWLRDNPAIALYQPSYYYVTTKNVNSWRNNSTLSDATDRFYGADDWTVNAATVRNTP